MPAHGHLATFLVMMHIRTALDMVYCMCYIVDMYRGPWRYLVTMAFYVCQLYSTLQLANCPTTNGFIVSPLLCKLMTRLTQLTCCFTETGNYPEIISTKLNILYCIGLAT